MNANNERKNNDRKNPGEEGAALLVTLLVVVIMTVTITEFLYTTWVDRSFAAGFRDSTKALYALRSGVDAARRIITDDYSADTNAGLYVDTLRENWAQASLPIPIEDTYMFVTITDESSKIDLNHLITGGGYPDQGRIDMFRRLLHKLEMDPDIANYVGDWIDTNSEGPAEDAYYSSLPRPYKCKNAKLDSVDELNRVRGITPEIFNKLKPFVTIRSSGFININTAPRELLMALDDDISDSLADSVIRARNEMPFKSKNEIQNVSGFQSIFPRIANLIDVSTDTFSVSATITFNEVTRKAEAILTNRTATSASVIFFRIN
jgi:general secretion pathway protein K